MTKAQQYSHWKALTEILEGNRMGHSIDRHRAADLADELRPHWPSFGRTLTIISRNMRS